MSAIVASALRKLPSALEVSFVAIAAMFAHFAARYGVGDVQAQIERVVEAWR